MYSILLILISLSKYVFLKYVEGEIHTKEDWIFLARFCFLSHQGFFEYYIEFNDDIGDLNLLLYYDDKDQWPAVYKTDKTCSEKESVLHIDKNQLIKLAADSPLHRISSGCYYPHDKILEKKNKSNGKTFTIKLPTLIPQFEKKSTTTNTFTTDRIPTNSIEIDDKIATESSIFDEFSTISSDFNYNNITNETIIKKINKRSIKYQKKNLDDLTNGKNIVCQNARSFSSSRERWWFIALSNCNSHKGIHVKYKFFMSNGLPGDYLHEHLSADEFYILPLLTAFSLSYTILLLGIIICTIKLKARQLLHSTYRIFCLSIVLQFLGIILQTFSYLKYALTGLDTIGIKRFGLMLMGTSETCFLLLLLLLGKGYTITRGRLPVSYSIKLTIFMCSYVVTYVGVFIYESVVFDPGEVLYLFESPAGYCLVTLRIIAWCVFVYSTIFTLKDNPKKGNFYYPFIMCGTFWFLDGPVFIISGNHYIDKWIRESVVCGMSLLVAFGGHLSFLVLTMPSIANKNFPYHVRTSQIGVMELISPHLYEPTTGITDQTVMAALNERTDEIFEGMYNQRNFIQNNYSQDVSNVEFQKGNIMDNVLNWSLAKNIDDTQHVGYKIERDILTPKLSRRSSQANSNGILIGRTQYVQEVPVELFTISTMVLNKNKTVADTEEHEKYY